MPAHQSADADEGKLGHGVLGGWVGWGWGAGVAGEASRCSIAEQVRVRGTGCLLAGGDERACCNRGLSGAAGRWIFTTIQCVCATGLRAGRPCHLLWELGTKGAVPAALQGYDVTQHVLACFGGAGGQHACAIAKALGIKTIFTHRYSGILSAVGIGLAEVVQEAQVCAWVNVLRGWG